MVATAEPTRRFVSIGVAARSVGVSPQTLRDWEARALIPPAARLEGMDRRLYSIADVEAIRQIRQVREAQRRQRDTSVA